MVARIGGDEFCVLLTSGSSDGASTGAERLRISLESANIAALRRYRLSVSVGIAIYEPDRPVSLEALMKQADDAMYAQKSARPQQAS